MHHVGVREGLSEEVSFQLRNKANERPTGRGIQSLGQHAKISTAGRESWQRGQAAQWHLSVSAPCPPHPCSRLCSPDNSKPTGLTLGL
jgi:hypothetical protein